MKLSMDSTLQCETKSLKFIYSQEFPFDYSIIGAEAVVRWQRPDGTVMIPDTFIPLYERNGRIIDLDFLYLKKL